MTRGKAYFTGSLEKRQHGVIFGIGVSFLLSALFLSTITYKIPFNFRDVCISNIGNPNHNPQSYLIFTFVCIFAGILLSGHQMYIYKNLKHISKIPAKIGLFLSLLGDVGLILVGIVNETYFPEHFILAGFAFGGMGLAIFVSVFMLMWDIYKRRDKDLIPIFSTSMIFLAVCSSIILREFSIYGVNVASDLFFTEWIAFFLVMGWQIILYLLPDLKKAE